MIRQEVSIDINRPVEQVYDFVITNYVANHPRFDPDTVLTELDGGGPMAQGKSGREVRKQMGREATYTFRIAELTGEHVTFAAESGSTKFGAVWSVKPSGSGAQLGIVFELRFGMPVRLFEPLMGGGVRKQMQASAQRIKELVEAS